MTKKEGYILTAFTGLHLSDSFSNYHQFVEDLLGRPVWTHELGSEDLAKTIKEKVTPMFLEIMENQTEQ